MESRSVRAQVVWILLLAARGRVWLARKCLERWNAAVGVDEEKDAFQPTSVQVLLMTEVNIR